MPFYHVGEVLHHSEENTDRNIVFNMSLSIYLTKKKKLMPKLITSKYKIDGILKVLYFVEFHIDK